MGKPIKAIAVPRYLNIRGTEYIGINNYVTNALYNCQVVFLLTRSLFICYALI